MILFADDTKLGGKLNKKHSLGENPNQIEK